MTEPAGEAGMPATLVSRRTVCTLGIAAAAVWGTARGALAARALVVEDWHEQHIGAKGLPKGWKRYETPGGHPAYDFTVVTDTDRPALHLRSADEHSTIAKEITVDLAATPTLEWEWKMIQLPTGADLRQKHTSDASGHLFVVWPRWPALLRSRLIGYVWDPTLDPGTIVHSRKTGTVTFIVVRSGQSSLGRWVTERRDVAADYRLVFGHRPDNPRAVALSIDTNDTHAPAETMFGRLAFTSA